MNMRDLVFPEREGVEPAATTRAADDPVARARAAQRVAVPKRFWRDVTLAPTPEGHALMLDGRPARTPARHAMAFQNMAVAELVAEEWRTVGTYLDPAAMPLTRLANVAIDRVAGAIAQVQSDLLAFAGSDLVCYRAGAPEQLVALQNAKWDPVLVHAQIAYGARFVLAEGVMFIAQPEAATAAIGVRVARISAPLVLAATHVMTTLTGSVLVALAVLDGALSAAEGFAAGEVDADFQATLWGRDAEAEVARARRERDFLAASLIALARR